MDFSKIDAYLATLPDCGIPAAELAVTKDGKTVYRGAVGFADAAKTRPVSNRDLYWIFSATKIVTCTAAMRLLEQGKIALSDPVSKYIPEYAEMQILDKESGTLSPAKTAMTVEHLFTMTGGMSYDLNTPNILAAKAPTATTLDMVRAMAKDPLRFEPGTHYRYSLCHDVLAAVCEVASGMRFSDYLQKEIFDPLEMKDIGFRPSAEQKARFSAQYRYYAGTATAKEIPNENQYCFSDNYDSGGAGLFAAVDDYIKLITVLANGGTAENGYVLLNPETVALMQENHLCDDARNDFVTTRSHGYGWGLCGRVHINKTVSRARSAIGEFGWDGAAGAYVLVDPTHRIALYYGMEVRSCQYAYHRVHPELRDLVYEALGIE